MTRKERIFARLQELGAEPKRSLGQNFLISDFVVDRILFAARAEAFTDLIEVGPGLGAITEDLLKVAEAAGAKFTLVELDRKFAEYWRERAESTATPMKVIEGDALQLNWLTFGLSENTLFVSNLPYQISSSLVIERSLEPAGISRMTLMFQKEVAQRIAAKPRSKEYGLLTVVAQTFWETATVCDAGPNSFFPPPNVSSRVLMFRKRKTDWLEQENSSSSRAGFLKFAKAAFSHRRKLMSRNLLGEYFGGKKDLLPQLETLFESQGLKATARAEELDPQAFVRLYLAVVNEKLGS